MKTLTLTLSGPEEIVDGLLPLFARAHGWTADSGLTPAEFSRDVISRYMRTGISVQAAADAAAAATAAATAAAIAAADQLTLTLSE